MQLECQNCRHLLNLPDAKLPVGRQFSFTCPYCKYKNTTIIPVAPDQPPEPESGYFSTPTPESESDYSPPPPAGQDSGPLPDGFQSSGQMPEPGGRYHEPPARKAPAGEGGDLGLDDSGLQSLILGGIDDRPKALVVYDDEEISSMLADKLEAIGYSPSVAVNLRDAAKQLKFANFVILLVQEDYYGANFHSNHLLRTIQNIDAHSRRNMLVILISPTMTTLDDLLAFSLSFDAVINSSELEGIDRLLLSIIARARKFYSIYREVLAEHGLD